MRFGGRMESLKGTQGQIDALWGENVQLEAALRAERAVIAKQTGELFGLQKDLRRLRAMVIELENEVEMLRSRPPSSSVGTWTADEVHDADTRGILEHEDDQDVVANSIGGMVGEIASHLLILHSLLYSFLFFLLDGFPSIAGGCSFIPRWWV